MQCCALTIIAIGCLHSSFFVASADTSTEQTSVVPFEEHLNRWRSFNCSVPQKRSYKINEHVYRQIQTHESIAPAYTTVNKCDGQSGCCAENQICGPKSTRYELVQIRLIDVVNTTGGSRYKVLKLRHDEICECKNRKTYEPSDEPVISMDEIP